MLIYKFLVPVLIYKWLIYSYLSKFRKNLVRVTGASCWPPAWQQDRRVAAAAASLSGSPLLPNGELTTVDRGRLPSGSYKQLEEHMVHTMSILDMDDDDMLEYVMEL